MLSVVKNRIMGVDPGSRICGWGCVDQSGNQILHVDHGHIQIANEKTFPQKLKIIYSELVNMIELLKPSVFVIETAFFSKNAASALKLGQVRGVAILCGVHHDLNIHEYSPNEIKQVISGYGHSDKEGMAKVVQLMIGNQTFQVHDESDALAIAICHALSGGTKQITRSKKRRISDIFVSNKDI